MQLVGVEGGRVLTDGQSQRVTSKEQGSGITELVVGTSFGQATITFKRTTQDCQIQIC